MAHVSRAIYYIHRYDNIDHRIDLPENGSTILGRDHADGDPCCALRQVQVSSVGTKVTVMLLGKNPVYIRQRNDLDHPKRDFLLRNRPTLIHPGDGFTLMCDSHLWVLQRVFGDPVDFQSVIKGPDVEDDSGDERSAKTSGIKKKRPSETQPNGGPQQKKPKSHENGTVVVKKTSGASKVIVDLDDEDDDAPQSHSDGAPNGHPSKPNEMEERDEFKGLEDEEIAQIIQARWNQEPEVHAKPVSAKPTSTAMSTTKREYELSKQNRRLDEDSTDSDRSGEIDEDEDHQIFVTEDNVPQFPVVKKSFDQSKYSPPRAGSRHGRQISQTSASTHIKPTSSTAPSSDSTSRAHQTVAVNSSGNSAKETTPTKKWLQTDPKGGFITRPPESQRLGAQLPRVVHKEGPIKPNPAATPKPTTRQNEKKKEEITVPDDDDEAKVNVENDESSKPFSNSDDDNDEDSLLGGLETKPKDKLSRKLFPSR